jgi:hypothetical protein
MSSEEDLQPISFDVDKLRAKLEKKFPDYDFSKPAPKDRRCKITTKDECPLSYEDRTLIYQDDDLVCVYKYKLQDPVISHKYEEKYCMAVLKTKEELENESKGVF